MPSFLFPYQPVNVPVYQHPMELMGKALMYRDAKVKEGISSIRGKYDSLLNAPLTNQENQEFLRTEMKSALDRIDTLSGSDLSLPENVGLAMTAFDPVTNDKKLMEDMAFTRHMSKVKSDIDNLRKEKPELVTPQNIDPVIEAEEEFRNARVRSSKDGASPRFVQFKPHYNFEAKDNEILSKVKADIDLILKYEDYVVDTPWDLRNPKKSIKDIKIQGEVKQLTDLRIRQALISQFNSDPQAMEQAALDHRYNLKYGLYNTEEYKNRVNMDIAKYDARIKNSREYLTSLDSRGLIDADTKTKYETAIGQMEAVRNTFNEKKVALESGNYEFNINDLYEAYINKQVGRWAYKEESKMDFVPGQKEVLDFTTSSMLKDLETLNKIEEERQKAVNEKAKGLSVKASDVFVIEVAESLEKTGAWRTSSPTDPAFVAFAGLISKDGKLSVSIAPSVEGDPASGIIVSPADMGKQPEKLKDLGQVQRMNLLAESLTKVDKKLFTVSEISRTTGTYSGGTSSFGTPVHNTAVSTSRPMNSSEKIGTILGLYQGYLKNKKEGKSDRYAKVFESATPFLNELSINEKTSPEILSGWYDKKVKSIGIDEQDLPNVIKFGIQASSSMNGTFEFMPDEDATIVASDQEVAMLNGWAVMSKQDAKKQGLPVAEYMSNGYAKLATDALPNLKSDATKSYADMIAIRILKPIKTSNESLVRLTQAAKAPLSGKDAVDYEQQSRDVYADYMRKRNSYDSFVTNAKAELNKLWADKKITREEYDRRFDAIRENDESKPGTKYDKYRKIEEALLGTQPTTKVVEFIKEAESFKEKAYPDGGRYSVGYGTEATSRDQTMTKEEAELYLQRDIAEHSNYVNQFITKPLLEEQRAALTSLSYNAGPKVLQTITNLINSGASEQKIRETWLSLALTEKGKSGTVPGLVNRRKKEVALFFGS